MSDEMVCTACGHVGATTKVTKGHFGLELLLWLCFLLPGLIYSVWRLTTRYQACPVCGNAQLLPRSSPMAQKFLRENFPDQQAAATPAAAPTSRAAHATGRALGQLVGKAFR